jgi:hypothetical protein
MANAQIMMSGETTEALRNGGFSLLVVTESQTGNGGAVPVVSWADQQFSSEMTVAIDSDERALVMFANIPMNVGTEVATLPATGMLLDLTQISDPQVSFDINDGWNWGGLPWGTEVNPGSEVAPLLTPSSGTRLA